MAITTTSKAQVFSLIAVMMSLFFIILFSGVNRVPLDKNLPQTQAEVQTVNELVLDLQTQVENALDSSSFKILNFTVNNLDGTNYYPNYYTVFDSCLESSTYYDTYLGATVDCSFSGEDVSFQANLQNIIDLVANVYGLNITIIQTNASMEQFDDPYALGVNGSARIRVSSPSANKHLVWERSFKVYREIEFNGITDPATIGTNYERSIQYKPKERTFSRPSFNGSIALIAEYIDNGYYFVDKTGTSFIERMQGDTTQTFDLIDAKKYGLGSFIPAYNKSGASLYLANTSMVDHHYYWGATPNPSLLRFINDPSINNNITLYVNYAEQGLGIDANLYLERADVYCGSNGCIYP